jgi:hypothetical protein
MLRATIDPNGKLVVVTPEKDADIIALGAAYVARELALATSERLLLPELALVQRVLAAAQASAQSATTNETQRAVSATDYAAALKEAKPLLDDALKQLKGQHSKNPAYLRNYTLETKVGARGDVQVARPTNEKGWVKFLAGYAAQQTALPEADRIVDPPLSRLVELNRIVTESLALRTSGSTQRQIGVKNRSAAVTQLLDLLQLAAFALCVTRYNSCVVEDLGLWGFKVIDKTSAAGAAVEPPTPAV